MHLQLHAVGPGADDPGMLQGTAASCLTQLTVAFSCFVCIVWAFFPQAPYKTIGKASFFGEGALVSALRSATVV